MVPWTAVAGNGPIKVTLARKKKKKRVQMLHGIKAATKRTPLRKSGSEGFVSQDPCDHNMGAKRLALASLPAGLLLGSALPSRVTFHLLAKPPEPIRKQMA